MEVERTTVGYQRPQDDGGSENDDSERLTANSLFLCIPTPGVWARRRMLWFMDVPNILWHFLRRQGIGAARGCMRRDGHGEQSKIQKSGNMSLLVTSL